MAVITHQTPEGLDCFLVGGREIDCQKYVVLVEAENDIIALMRGQHLTLDDVRKSAMSLTSTWCGRRMFQEAPFPPGEVSPYQNACEVNTDDGRVLYCKV